MPAQGQAESWNMSLVGHSDLDGHGKCMLINFKDHYAYIGHMDNRGTSIADVSDPENPRFVGHIPAPPNTHSHKTQVVGDILVVNRERLPDVHGGSIDRPWTGGLEIYDVSDPVNPRQISLWRTPGRGVHRMTYWEEPYAYLAASDEGYDGEFLVILDLSDPANPTEVARWWVEGQRTGAGEQPSWGPETTVKLHHALPMGDRLYAGWWDQGIRIHDISDIKNPTVVSHLDFGDESRMTHTVCPFPGRDIVVTTDECTEEGPLPYTQDVRVVDISDETNPRVISKFPIPQGDFATRGLRFGPHNLHEMRPGSQQDPYTAYLTYFNAGIRVVDLTDPADPTEIGYYVPPAPPGAPAIQLNDLIVGQDGLIYVGDRAGGGLYIFALDSAANSHRKSAPSAR
jgi:hypothetical protein